MPSEIVSQQRTPLTLLMLGLAVVAALVWLARERRGLLPGERAMRIWVYRHPLRPPWRRLVIGYVSLGRPRTACLTVAGIALATTLAAGWRAGLLSAAAATVVGPARALKARALYRTVPSGHVAYAVSLFGMAACVALQQGYAPAAAALALLGLAMGPARIFDGGHFVADVAAGYALGSAWLLALLLVGSAWALPG